MLVAKIKELCAEQKITVAELERRAGLGNGVIRRWDTMAPRAYSLYAVSKVLGTDASELWDEWRHSHGY